jgi:tripartite-type tricarboxylate transporter receptor subunit TctC
MFQHTFQHWAKAASMCALAVALPSTAAAQGPAASYPTRPVTMVVPFAAGSATDIEGRLHAAKLTESLGQPFVLDFKPGAGNRIATEHLMKSAPDGHTLMFTAATHSVIPLSYPDLPYDLYKVLAPVSLITKRYGLMIVHPSLPIRNMKEYIAYAKANPGKIHLITAGAGGTQHLTGLWLNAATGTEATMVHYKSANAGIVDLLAGRVQLYIGTRQSTLPHIKSGKVRAVAQTTLVRHPDDPDLPTASETVPGFEYLSWLGLLAPARTPEPIRGKLAAELNKALKSPDIVQKLGKDAQLIGSSPQEFERMYLQEHEIWKKIVKDANVKFE